MNYNACITIPSPFWINKKLKDKQVNSANIGYYFYLFLKIFFIYK